MVLLPQPRFVAIELNRRCTERETICDAEYLNQHQSEISHRVFEEIHKIVHDLNAERRSLVLEGR